MLLSGVTFNVFCPFLWIGLDLTVLPTKQKGPTGVHFLKDHNLEILALGRLEMDTNRSLSFWLEEANVKKGHLYLGTLLTLSPVPGVRWGSWVCVWGHHGLADWTWALQLDLVLNLVVWLWVIYFTLSKGLDSLNYKVREGCLPLRSWVSIK